MFKSTAAILSLVVLVQIPGPALAYTLPSGETLADPTQPVTWQKPKSAKKKQISYKLNYVFSSSSQKKAIINGKTVSEGESVDSAKVLRIFDGGVTLLVNGRSTNLSLKPNTSFKKTR